MNPTALVVFEDEHVLVVNKPAGWGTHAPSQDAGEGLYEWLRDREPRWADLSIIHRLDKETSGLILFAKTPLACGSLTQQFADRRVRKCYVMLTDRPVPARPVKTRSALVRLGDKYTSRPPHAGAALAETTFHRLSDVGGRTLVSAEPFTGRTHQIRVQAAEAGFPVLGDTLYGGSPAPRLCLHAAELIFAHPAAGRSIELSVPAEFDADARLALRVALVDPTETNAYRLVHGAADRWPGWYVDRLGDCVLSQSASEPTPEQCALLARWIEHSGLRGCYHKTLRRRVREATPETVAPGLILGVEAPSPFPVRENGVRFLLSFKEGYSIGLFLDQRDNRRRVLLNHVAAGFPVLPQGLSNARVLNLFAYTCGFSVCAALAGAVVTSVDLSEKHLKWGRHNFAENGLPTEPHEFVRADVFDWMKRSGKKGCAYDVVLVDPPTLSSSKSWGLFRVEKDYPELILHAQGLVKPGGVLWLSANAASLTRKGFLDIAASAVRRGGRRVLQEHFAPQPPDFPVSRDEPPHLKSLWLRLA